MVGVTGSIPVAPTSHAELFGTQVATASDLAIDGRVMKVKNSLKSLRSRHRDNRVVRRKGRVYVINKTQRRYKARQG